MLNVRQLVEESAKGKPFAVSLNLLKGLIMKINKDTESLELPEIEFPCEIVAESNLHQTVLVCGAYLAKGENTVKAVNEDFAIKFVSDCHALSLMNGWDDFVTLTFQPEQEADEDPKAETKAEAKAGKDAGKDATDDAKSKSDDKKNDSDKKAGSDDVKADAKKSDKDAKATKKAK